MANASLQIGNGNWAIKEDNLLGYSKAGTRFLPIPITMTRATLGTRVNPSGLIENVELLGSELVTNGDFSNGLTDWTENGGSYATIVSGALNSNNPDAGNWYAENISQPVSFVNGTFYKVTFKAKNISGGLNLRITHQSHIIFSDNLTSNFVDYTVYYTAQANNDSIRIFCNTAVGQFEIDNVSVKEVTRDDLARVDYTDGTASLLVEPQRTNLVTYSEDFTNAFYQKIRSSVTANQIISPDETQNADKFIEDSSNSTHLLWTQDITVNVGDVITWSVYAKKGERSWMFLRDTAAGNFTSWFDLENGVTGTKAGTLTANIEDAGNGWYRCSITYTSTSTTAKGRIYIATADGTEPYQGNGTSGVYLFGAQLEAGSYPTSYIKTTGSTVTRNQDEYTKTGISDKINSEEGVLFVEMAALVNADATNPNRGISISSGSTNNTIYIYFQSGTNRLSFILISGGTTQFSGSTTSFDVTSFNKIALKYKANDFALWINGTEIATDTSGTAPTGLSELRFDNGAGNDKLFGKVKQLQVFKTALSDSELATLTT